MSEVPVLAVASVSSSQSNTRAVISRADSPRYFWTGVAIYALLALALVTIF